MRKANLTKKKKSQKKEKEKMKRIVFNKKVITNKNHGHNFQICTALPPLYNPSMKNIFDKS